EATGTANPLAVTMSANKTLTATFTASAGTATFYRAVNINGGALVLDGQNWVGSSGAANFQVPGSTFSNQTIPLVPATDATRAGMIRSSVYGPSIAATMSNVPAGTYSVYLYVWEDNKAEVYTIRLEGQVVRANYNSGSAGSWARLGPFTAAITDGTINVTTSGGYANLSGFEVWRQNPAARTALTLPEGTEPDGPQTIAARPSRTALPVQAYPNPSADGRYEVLLPTEFGGTLTYTLLSATGARLAQGTRQCAPATSRLAFDFTPQQTPAGLYYLLLEGPGLRARVKLMRE
ncbi:hypothetical protein LGH70_16600, partial [Hymenobacter sp. BT635]